MADAEDWITIGEAARRLGVSTDTVRRRADVGELRTRWTKPPKRGWRMVAAADVEAYRKQMGQDPATERLDGSE